jgi:uncharacterized protein
MLLLAASCATPSKNIQPQINSLVAAQHFDRALQFLDNDPAVYGPRNELLYWLDRGMTAQLAGRYNDSIASFEQAKHKYDELYTRSITQMATTWVVNDYSQDYRGDDHEFIMLNIAQALNFAVQGAIYDAVVEARDVDMKLNMINARYKEGQTNVYKDDAFARFLSGILWQATETDEGYNDAYIAYSRAMKIYEEDYQKNYGIAPPQVLKENLAAMQTYMDRGIKPSRQKAEVYVFEYLGFVPLKVSDAFVFPVDFEGHIMKVAFPRYAERFKETQTSLVFAKIGSQEYFRDTQLVQDLGGIARKIMDSRKASILAKSTVRPAIKQVAERVIEHQVRTKYGELPAAIAMILGDVYNMATEEPDLRSWQTLPNEIRVAKLTLEPGTYDLYVQDMDETKGLVEKRPLGTVTLKAGEKKFLLTRGYR